MEQGAATTPGVRFVPRQIPTFQPLSLPGLGQIPSLGSRLSALPLPTYPTLALVPLAHTLFSLTPWGSG